MCKQRVKLCLLLHLDIFMRETLHKHGYTERNYCKPEIKLQLCSNPYRIIYPMVLINLRGTL